MHRREDPFAVERKQVKNEVPFEGGEGFFRTDPCL
jgi:hypothetical protein